MKVVHEFVDREGKTHFDEFKLLTPLDMGEVPKTYCIVLNTAANAARLAERTKEHGFGDTDTVVFTGCPHAAGPHSAASSWEVAKTRVRELCFENDPAIVGGLRRATAHDAATSGLVVSFHELEQVLRQAASVAVSDDAVSVRVQIPPAVIAQVSGHFLWRRLHWIAGMKPEALLRLVGVFVDPTWLTDDNDPRSCRRFIRAFVGGRNHRPTIVAAYFAEVYKKALARAVSDDSAGMSFGVDPSLFAVRYGARWACKHMGDGATDAEALSLGALHAAAHVGRYVWLSWMSFVHPTEIEFDRERFFGDAEIANFAYQQAL